MTIKVSTHRELQLTADNNIQVGSMLDLRRGIQAPLYINYIGNEEYWEEQEEIHIKQSEFQSLGISYFFFKDERINKNNPNIYRDAWIPFSDKEEKGEVKMTPLPAFQELWKDKIGAKIIADGETIDAIRAMKEPGDVGDILHVFDQLEKWDVKLNIPKTMRKKVYTAKGSMEIEVTNLEDYDFEVKEEEMSWRDYKKLIDADKEWHRVDNRLNYLVGKLETYEERLDPAFKRFSSILINAYPELKMYQAAPDDRYGLKASDLYKDIESISQKYGDASYKSLWQTWYNYVIPQLKKEINYLMKDGDHYV